MSIRVLDDALVNKIAAGEVVERPASIVKELVENSLDAGAKVIRVALRQGGRALVRVSDDGVGMGPDDALMCLERHATSKIRTEEDLARVATLGFRGEALPSIAAVCRFQLTTRTAAVDAATRVRVEGGKLLGVGEAGAAPGTEIECRSLFYNLPVRRKFLRSAPTELGHCVQAVLHQALDRPEVDFTVLHDGREVLRAPAVADLGARARDLLGEQLVPVAFEDRGFRITGLIGPPSVHRSTRTTATHLFVNGRYVRDSVVSRGIAEAYRGLLPPGRHPVVLLEIALDPERVDVNVHPAKTEVRFRDPGDLRAVIARGVEEALHGAGLRQASRAAPVPLRHQGARNQPALPLHPEGQVEAAPAYSEARAAESRAAEARAEAAEAPRYPPPARLDPLPPPSRPQPISTPVAAEPIPGRLRDLPVLAVFDGRWILCDGEGDLVLIDGRAAQAQVSETLFVRERRDRLGAGQRLLAPVAVALGAQDQVVLRAADALSALHLEIEAFAPGTVAVRAVPASLQRLDVPALLAELVVDLGKGLDPAGTLARHGAVGIDLDTYGARTLLAALDETEVRPRGVARLPTSELERWTR